ncbi:HAD-IA family hydrolase [Nocardioides sp. HDW12B]|uniref:HAD family hydrolase n=1 Tax=Nocardioides sp. HDW12B TaxID=2714939 RepID=UPI00140B4E36|nr:HAD-IA family hydrolase [Nocardioides sp. HDW12B]QIK68112.1 HAD-IA family hydrolase [Nocardioides sp. HDW12B]
MPALLLGSISTVVDTSELQRESFNRAFEQHGLDWRWEREEYADLLGGNGGADRVADYAAQRGEDVDAAAVHATKSQLFQDALRSADLTPRDGVVETVRDARAEGFKVALVTTTSRENLDALAAAVSATLPFDEVFDLVVDSSQVSTPKPDGSAYRHALEALEEDSEHAVAVEDNVGGVSAARAAGVPCVAFPNQNTAGHDFDGAAGRVDELGLAALRTLAGR